MEIKVTLEWTAEAYNELFSIYEYYEDIDPSHGLHCIDEIEKQVNTLISHPLLGVKSNQKEVRKLIIAKTPYIVAYQLIPHAKKPEIAYVLSVMDGRNFNKTKNY